jgi:Domain of unknown function (DUF4430)
VSLGRTRTVRATLATFVTAAAIAGCGLGTAPTTQHAGVLVTSDFGTHVVGVAVEQSVPANQSVMALLDRHFQVSRQVDGAVEAIDGHRGTSGHMRWSYYVNGIEAPKRAAMTDVNKGDRIWWDLHDSSATGSIPAVVGSYPEPFTNGSGGKEFPTLLNCAAGVQDACDLVGEALHRVGVKAAEQVLGTGSGSDSLAVVIGTWSEIKHVIAAQLIAAGPGISGVYAQFVGSRRQVIELDNQRGSVVRTLRGSVGLIAATNQPALGQPTWLVTGPDAAGVLAAARAFTALKLRNHFALAVAGAAVIPVPITR